MNYLAHALLSFDDADILTGNMLGDFVKGKNYLKLPLPIQPGILLHRYIDRCTDDHPLVHEAMAVFKPTFLLSAGVFVDIFFDHFLANDPRYFTDNSLLIFTQSTYATLKQSSYLFDEKMSMFFSYMAQHNWLYHYSEMEGIEKSVRGICKRYPRLGDADEAIRILKNNFDKLNGLYAAFFPELRDRSQQKMIELSGGQGAS